MITKFVNNVANQPASTEAVEQGANEDRKTKRETKLVDVIHEFVRSSGKNLEGLVRMGGPGQEREQFKGKVRKKVWDTVDENLGTVDRDMVEEITERVVDAADADPYYKKMFEEEEETETSF